jgi:uncharacterized protein (TIRG00374 family)
MIKTLLSNRVFQLVISVILLLLLLQMVDLEGFSEAVINANPYYLLTAAVLMTANRILMPIKWNLLLRSHQLMLGWGESIRIYYISTFFGLFLPATVGADSLRAIYTKQFGIKLEDSLASIVVERLLGALTTLTVGVLGGIIFISFFTNDSSGHNNAELSIMLTIVGILLVLFLGIFYLTLSNWFANIASQTVNRYGDSKRLGKIISLLYKLYSAYAIYRDRKAIMCVFIFLTVIETAMPVIWSWLVALAIGIDQVDLIYYLAFVPLTLLLIRLPISLDGFGINEGAYVYFLSLVGVSAAAGFAIGLITHILFLACLTPGILVYLMSGKRFQPVVASNNNQAQ